MTNLPRLAVFGNPVAHSLSPRIHEMFAAKFGFKLDYQKIEVPLTTKNEAADTLFYAKVNDFFAAGAVGGNVTVPFKTCAYNISQHRTMAAKAAGAVNTLSYKDGKIWGDNTDGAGLVNALLRLHNFDVTRKRVLILGAGGAARGAIVALIKKTGYLHLANRTVKTALALGRKFRMTSSSFERLEAVGHAIGGFDLIINATAASLSGDTIRLPASCLTADTLVYDMMYSRKLTPFLAAAQQQGCRVSDGFSMLVGQAALSFKVWFGYEPDIKPVYEVLEAGRAQSANS